MIFLVFLPFTHTSGQRQQQRRQRSALHVTASASSAVRDERGIIRIRTAIGFVGLSGILTVSFAPASSSSMHGNNVTQTSQITTTSWYFFYKVMELLLYNANVKLFLIYIGYPLLMQSMPFLINYVAACTSEQQCMHASSKKHYVSSTKTKHACCHIFCSFFFTRKWSQ